jgi:reversibly glycosylated polypeptide/UDP-arabinopyranose mutase
VKVALVIPSCRGEQLQAFLEAWEPVRFWDTLVIVEDGPTRTFDVPTPHHFAHADIDKTLGPDAWIISRRDSAIRSFGFLIAYRLGADLIVTLDDDCQPHPGRDFLRGHLDALERTTRWASSVPGMRVRGLPYENLGTLSTVKLNVGLWSGVPDLDASTRLVCGAAADFTPPAGSRVLPSGQYVPICGMNLAFRREFAPLSYFPLMGEGQPYRRFDDIWFGLIAKRICDHLGWHVTVGTPWVRHIRVSDPYANLVKEAPGIALNERLWQIVDALPLTEATAAGCLVEVGQGLQESGDEYLQALGRALRVWAGFFDGK